MKKRYTFLIFKEISKNFNKNNVYMTKEMYNILKNVNFKPNFLCITEDYYFVKNNKKYFFIINIIDKYVGLLEEKAFKFNKEFIEETKYENGIYRYEDDVFVSVL